MYENNVKSTVDGIYNAQIIKMLKCTMDKAQTQVNLSLWFTKLYRLPGRATQPHTLTKRMRC